MKKIISTILLLACVVVSVTGCVDWEHYKNQQEIKVESYKIGQDLTKKDLETIVNKYNVTEISTLMYDKNHELYMFSRTSGDMSSEQLDEVMKSTPSFLKVLTYKSSQIQGQEPTENIELIVYTKGDLTIKTYQELLMDSLTESEDIKTKGNEPISNGEVSQMNSMFSMIYGVTGDYKEGMTYKEFYTEFIHKLVKEFRENKLKMFAKEPLFDEATESNII